MRKSLLLCSLLLLAGLCIGFQAKRAYTKSYYVDLQQRSDALKRLDTLFAMQQYDSVIQYCNRARNANHLDYSMAELALATAYWYKNDRSTAYLYVQNSADYSLKLNGGGGDPFNMLYDYTFGPALASDTFLKRLITVRVADYYRSLEYYPERNTGLKLLLLDYQRHQSRERYRYEQQQQLSKAQLQQAAQRYKEATEDWTGQLMALLQENQKLFTRDAVGPAAENQVAMILGMEQPEYLKACLPLMQRSCKDGDISGDSYVDALVVQYGLEHPGNSDEAHLRDSLCRIYHCRRVTFDSTGRGFSYYKGDYFTIKSDTFYYKDSKDSTRMMISRPTLPANH